MNGGPDGPPQAPVRQLERAPMSDERELRNVSLFLRVLPSVKEALEEAAKDDHRSASALAEMLIIEGLKERGYLNDH